MRSFSSGSHFPMCITRSEVTGAEARGKEYCSFSPLLGSFNQIVDSIYVTPLEEIKHAAIGATRAQLSGLDAVVDRRNPPNLHRRIRTSFIDKGRKRDAQISGVVAMGSGAFVRFSWAD